MHFFSMATALFAAVAIAVPSSPSIPSETQQDQALERRADISAVEGLNMGLSIWIPVLGPAVWGWALTGRKKKNCRAYQAVFYSCIEKGLKPPSTYLVPRVEQGISGNSPNPLDPNIYEGFTVNKCLGGDGARMLSENVLSKETWGCAAKDQRYEHKVQIWRWRNKWQACADFDWYMTRYVNSKTPIKFWYSTPGDSQVKCVD